jgi:hypothetical protein
MLLRCAQRERKEGYEEVDMAIIEVSGACCTGNQHSTLNEGAFLLQLGLLCRQLGSSETLKLYMLMQIRAESIHQGYRPLTCSTCSVKSAPWLNQ